ncbi:hypothetical protein [Lujinxingia litoralis]|nr:hypothetical protein [Lujinxingia litoralis]
MFTYILKTLERHLLSPARRLFIYEQLDTIAREHQLRALHTRIEKARLLDSLNVDRSTRWRLWNRMERTHPGLILRALTTEELREGSERGQQELLTLVYFIIHSPTLEQPELRTRLLNPLLQQMRRLEHYAERAPTPAGADEPTQKNARPSKNASRSSRPARKPALTPGPSSLH